jgi:predicted molibdopterin-dependent oxidoreductase YjgC
MFRRRHPGGARLTIFLDGEPVAAVAGETVAAALLAHGLDHGRATPVSGSPRAPYCMMGVCFECLMEIDGAANRQACMVPATEGMRVRRQRGKVEVGR